MRIAEFARRAGASPSRIRFYEARGLLPPPARAANGYRTYAAADLRIVGFVDRARALGFSLAEVARFMSRPAGERRRKAGVVAALEAKLAEADRRLAEAQAQRGRIVSLLSDLYGAEPGGSAPP